MAQWQQWRHNRRGGRGLWWPRPTFSQFVALLVKSIDSQHGSTKYSCHMVAAVCRRAGNGMAEAATWAAAPPCGPKPQARRRCNHFRGRRQRPVNFVPVGIFLRACTLSREGFLVYRVQSPPICCQQTIRPYVHFLGSKKHLTVNTICMTQQ